MSAVNILMPDVSAISCASRSTFTSKAEQIKLCTKRYETYPADCRKIAAVDSNKHDWD